jgi:hypothetical protein
MSHREVSNTDNIIDSRDVIARIAELESLEGSVTEAIEARNNAATEQLLEVATDVLDQARENFGEEEAEELKILRALAEEGEGCGDWAHGETLIRDSYFEKYAEELADDLGAVPRDAKWPMTCIDWKQAAEELQVDYTSVNFDNVIYWMRS